MYSKKLKTIALREMIIDKKSSHEMESEYRACPATLWGWAKKFKKQANKVLDIWQNSTADGVHGGKSLAELCVVFDIDPKLLYFMAEERAGIK